MLKKADLAVALLITLVSLACIVGLALLGTNLQAFFNNLASNFPA